MIPRQSRIGLDDTFIEFLASEADLVPAHLIDQNITTSPCALSSEANFFMDPLCGLSDLQAVADLGQRWLDTSFNVKCTAWERGANSAFKFTLINQLARMETFRTAIPLQPPSMLQRVMRCTTIWLNSFPDPDAGSQAKWVDYYTFWGSRGVDTSVVSQHVMKTRNPYVAAKCGFQNTTTSTASATQKLLFQSFGPTMSPFSNITLGEVIPQGDDIQQNKILWKEVPSDLDDDLSIVAIATIPDYVCSCVLKAAWGDAEINGTVSNPSTQTLMEGPGFGRSWQNASKWSTDTVKISPEWALQLMPQADSLDSSNRALHGFIAAGTRSNAWVTPADMSELMLSSLLAAGMSRIMMQINGTTPYIKDNTAANARLHDHYSTMGNSYYTGPGYSVKGKTAIAAVTIYLLYILRDPTHCMVDIQTPQL